MRLLVALFALFVGAASGQLFEPAPVSAEPEKPSIIKRIFSVPGKIVRSILDALRIIYQIQRHLFGHTVDGMSELIEHLKVTLQEVVRTLTGKTSPEPTFNDLPYSPVPPELLGSPPYHNPYEQPYKLPYGQPYSHPYPTYPQPYGHSYPLPSPYGPYGSYSQQYPGYQPYNDPYSGYQPYNQQYPSPPAISYVF